jgi:hypothetical protein
MLATQNNDSGKAAMENFPQQESGTARDAAASKVGFKNSRTAEQAAEVAREFSKLKSIDAERAKRRMSEGGGDKKSGKENFPDPIQDNGRDRYHAANSWKYYW